MICKALSSSLIRFIKLYSPPSELSRDRTLNGQIPYSTRHWTIILLAPGYFFDENNTSFPMKNLPTGTKQNLGHCLGRLTKLGAEMNIIGQGLQRISERWADFQAFFEYILDGGDSLMQPTQHDNLLFDDGSFSRSRRYFWAIDCLSEFDLSITDNVVQWQLFKNARVEPLLDSHSLSELDYLQFKMADKQYNILKNQREYFRQKLTATEALRDAVSTAEAILLSLADYIIVVQRQRCY